MALAVATTALAYVLSISLGRPAPSTIVVERNPLLDQPAPQLSLATVQGERVSLSDYLGRPVIVNFWASWCVPCREEFPVLRAARERYASDGLEILGVIHDDGPQTALAFADSYGATWPMLVDESDTAWNAYRGVFLPISYFIDRDGIVRTVSYGPPPAGVLEEQIAEIL